MGVTANICASETIHNKSNMLIKKPREFLLFSEKPKGTSILNSIIKSKGATIVTEKKITEMDGLFVKGINKFKSEVDYAFRIPESVRVYVKTKDAIEEENMRTLGMEV